MTRPRVRVRYAPSPTGEPHVGNIRTAIWTWLHARHTGGDFIVRVEDTDQAREVPGSVERILDSLRWLGLDWDEGPDIGGPYAPYTQSERLEDYRAAADRLIASGHAYRCFCSSARLDALRTEQQKAKRPTGYDGLCRSLPPADAQARADAGEPHVVRFAVPESGTTTAEDLLRGPITVENSTMDDFVLLKSDGFPTYHLAHAVDDEAMAITHITRGDEWIPSLPRHVLIFDALGYQRPIYVHTPIILAPGGGKLSKRHGAKSVLEYAEDGYLPDALVNFLCLMGWGHGDETVFSRLRLIDIFDLKDLSLAPATFDTEKLNWLNGVYMRALPEDELSELFARRLERDLPPDVPRPIDRALVEAFTPLIRERVQVLSEVAPLVDFFFDPDVPVPPIEEFLKGRWKDQPHAAIDALTASARTLEDTEPFTAPVIEERMRALTDHLGAKPGDLFTLNRLAVTGRRVAPPLFETMEIVGQGVCVDRLEAAARAIGEASAASA